MTSDTAAAQNAAMNDSDNLHSDWLGWLAFSAGLAVVDVARRLGVSRQAVNNWKLGKREPTKTQWRALADLIGVTPAQYWAGPSKDVAAVVRVVAA